MVLILAILLSLLMLATGLALLSFTDQQTTTSAKERVQESTLTLSEGALNALANALEGIEGASLAGNGDEGLAAGPGLASAQADAR